MGVYNDTAKKYFASPAQKKRRAEQNAARAAAEKAGLVRKGDGKEVSHKRAADNGGSTKKGNLFVQPASKNRSWRKGQQGYRVPNV
jgi:hypothetical protein